MVIGYCSCRIHERDQTIGVRFELFPRIFCSGSGPQGASRLRSGGVELIDSFSGPHSLQDLIFESDAFGVIFLESRFRGFGVRGNRPDINVAVADVPAFLAVVLQSAAGEFGHASIRAHLVDG
jgi:hypothetical protein